VRKPLPYLMTLAAFIAVTGGAVAAGVARAATPTATAHVNAFVAPLLAAHDDARAGFFPAAARHGSRTTNHGGSESCAI